jgi:glycine/D-amino acid oxidase-like deaminating enzyme
VSARVAVIGGGLAGIAAALDCAAAGASVTLLEVRPQLGGAVYSFQRAGLQMDNGQHVFLRCYTAYRDLLERIGGSGGVYLQERLEIPVLAPGGRLALLRRSNLPVPLHLARALLSYSHLSLRERVRAALAARALGRVDSHDPAAEARTLGEWLAERGQSAQAVANLWDVIALPALNLPASEASLALGAFVFRKGLLESADAGDMGFHVRPLSEIVGEPAQRALRAAGVELRLGWRAELVRRARGGFEVLGSGRSRVSRGERDAGGGGEDDADDRRENDADEEREADAGGVEGIEADAVIVALPHARTAALLERSRVGMHGDVARRAAALGETPIVNLHVVYDRVVCELPFVAGVGTPVQDVFDRSEAGGLAGGQYLAISLSGATREMAMSVDALRERYVPAIAELFPRAREAKLESFVATREHAATFRAAPGCGALRAAADTGVAGLALAGAWTATGWPATLEGAVRSGHTAARCVLEAL